MRPLLNVFLIVATVFASTFLLIKFTGLLTIEQIEGWLTQAKESSPIYVGAIVALLLFSDLFIAIPTLTVAILAGYFLGHTYGALASLTGIVLAGISGYVISRYYGGAILGFLLKDESKRNDAINTFQKHGFVMILLSRAMPILPEATGCLSGMTHMPFNKFFAAWLISSVPYILIATYAGSISSVENPMPAIFTAIGLSVFLWIAWFFYHRANKK
ncbi:hypothetical protein MNBD_GAMMA21-2509 [hydrothermal vent metagenome]|uniref:VTT domain-containing protein n=1 Tax=hydrothermal vent metagenome TaxID=652676 RepID=A0A3B1ABM1_9ZZZZ